MLAETSHCVTEDVGEAPRDEGIDENDVHVDAEDYGKVPHTEVLAKATLMWFTKDIVQAPC